MAAGNIERAVIDTSSELLTSERYARMLFGLWR